MRVVRGSSRNPPALPRNPGRSFCLLSLRGLAMISRLSQQKGGLARESYVFRVSSEAPASRGAAYGLPSPCWT